MPVAALVIPGDAMTVEAVPSHDDKGRAIPEDELKCMHITMQTLGRIAIIGGSAMVAGIGGWLAGALSYKVMYEVALIIPVISVLGVTLGQIKLVYAAANMPFAGARDRPGCPHPW